MQSINHPIVNDDKYGDFKANKTFSLQFKYKYQFLHSYKIKFNNIDGILSYLNGKQFIAPLKEKQDEIIYQLFNKHI